MEQLREYLEDSKPKEMKNERSFVKKATFQKDEHYEELSVAFFKFETSEHRRIAMDILSQKRYDEELQLSEQILLQKRKDDHMEEEKGDDDKNNNKNNDITNLGWNHRVIPRCCCA